MESDQPNKINAEDLIKEIEQLIADNKAMRKAIKKALADAESGDGWGPDVTVCGYLNAAIKTL